jgi:hypothetical protein
MSRAFCVSVCSSARIFPVTGRTRSRRDAMLWGGANA